MSESKEPRNTLTVIDNRTGKSIEIPIYSSVYNESFVDSTEFKKLKTNDEDSGITLFDPSFLNTAVAKSKICYIDGDKGILKYRGYAIEDLAEHCSFMEVCYLLLWGELPSKNELREWESTVMTHTYLHKDLVNLMANFRYDAHPMSILISSISALSSFYEEANPALNGPGLYKNEKLRNKQIVRILGKLPTIAAAAYRHRIGRSYNEPKSSLGYVENFLFMMDRLNETNYKPHPKLVRALEILFIIHAEHEMNCSTATMRTVGSALTDPYSCIASAASALYGPLHGGANERVLEMFAEIGTKENIPAFLEKVKQKKALLFGFGHRIYKNFDPRAKLVKQLAKEVFEICSVNEKVKNLWEIAEELERQALTTEYFVSRKLYPNIDFYSGCLYTAMGLPTDMFPVLFAIPRAVGWLAHWLEQITENDGKIYRPRQFYLGQKERDFVPLEERQEKIEKAKKLNLYHSDFSIRRQVSLSYLDSTDEIPLK